MKRAAKFCSRCLLGVLWLSSFGGGGPGLERIAEDLQSKVPAVRRDAVKRVGGQHDRRAVDLLIQVLEDDAPLVRSAAAELLGELEAKRAAPALADALQDEDQTVRYYAAHALGEIAAPSTIEPLVAALRDSQWCVRSEAAWALREIDGPRVVQRLQAALEGDGNVDLDHVTWILRKSYPEALVDILSGRLNNGTAAKRLEALGRLARLEEPSVPDTLVAALHDDNPRVRLAAVEALRERGDRQALEPLRRLARREKNEHLRKAASQAALVLSRHPDLVAHWRFDEKTGDTAIDSGGREIHGDIKNCRRVDGKRGQALEFSDNGCVELGKPPEFPVAQRAFTVAAWVKTDHGDGVVVARGGAFCGFSLYIKDGVAKFGIHRTEEGESYIAAGEENVTGEWVHLAGMVDEQAVRVYVNGKKVDEKKTPGFLPGNCGQPMAIGFDSGNSPAEITDHFRGIIDEVKGFHAALTAEELTEFCHIQL